MTSFFPKDSRKNNLYSPRNDGFPKKDHYFILFGASSCGCHDVSCIDHLGIQQHIGPPAGPLSFQAHWAASRWHGMCPSCVASAPERAKRIQATWSPPGAMPAPDPMPSSAWSTRGDQSTLPINKKPNKENTLDCCFWGLINCSFWFWQLKANKVGISSCKWKTTYLTRRGWVEKERGVFLLWCPVYYLGFPSWSCCSSCLNRWLMILYDFNVGLQKGKVENIWKHHNCIKIKHCIAWHHQTWH